MRIGVLGSFCSDVICDPSGAVVHRGPGGIAHSLLALDAWVPVQWTLAPWSRIGEDHDPMIAELFPDADRVEREGLERVPGPGYQAVLRYIDREERAEFIDHVGAPFALEALEARLADVDAALVNFISGREIDLADLDAICKRVQGPVVLDLHSACLDLAPDGRRTQRARLKGWEEWLGGVDVLQVNAQEVLTLDGHGLADDELPLRERVAARAMEGGAQALVITRGADGSEVHDRKGTYHLPAAFTGSAIDPTGCGDVHAAGMLTGLLHGLSPREAARIAAVGAGWQARSMGCSGKLPAWSDLLAEVTP